MQFTAGRAACDRDQARRAEVGDRQTGALPDHLELVVVAPDQPRLLEAVAQHLIGHRRNLLCRHEHQAGVERSCLLDVQLASGDAASTLVPYPQVSADLTAGQWNRAGSANNRIEIRLP